MAVISLLLALMIPVTPKPGKETTLTNRTARYSLRA